MLLLLTILCLLNLMSGQKIIGGIESAKGRYPYLAGLAMGKQVIPYCGGVLISTRYVLSAAHCQDPKYVYVGCFNSEDESCDRIKPQKVIRHPQFNHQNLRFDFMLLELSVTSTMSPISYLSSNNLQLPNNLESRAMGFGVTESGSMSSKLMEVTLTTLTLSKCRSIYRHTQYYVFEENLCAAGNGKDTCQGDSGGPLIYPCEQNGDVLLGLTSWGIGCAQGYPGVYAKVSQAYKWIKDIVSDTEAANSVGDKSFYMCEQTSSPYPTSLVTAYPTSYPTFYPTYFPTSYPITDVSSDDSWWCFLGFFC